MTQSGKVILCDLFDVLVEGMQSATEAIGALAGLPSSEVEEIYFTADFRPLWLGRESELQFFDRLLGALGWGVTSTDLTQIIRSNFLEIPGSRQLYRGLSLRHRTVLVSVAPPEWASVVVERFDLEQLFHAMYWSYEVGATKRERAFFRWVADRENVTASDLLLIDDSNRNLAVAAGCGIDGIRFKSAQQMQEILVARGLLH